MKKRINHWLKMKKNEIFMNVFTVFNKLHTLQILGNFR